MNNKKSDITTIYERFRRVGNAIARINANNTHSGNISMIDPGNPDIFYITATGSQCGSLVLRDIVPIRFTSVSWGDARGSTESTIHRRILSLPGINAGLHAHALYSTYISYDTQDKELFLNYTGLDRKNREEYEFFPVDLFGAFIIGKVNVAHYFEPVGSEEMDERIPAYLENNKVTIVKGHGPFIKAKTLEGTLHYMNVFEHSATLAISLRKRGFILTDIEKGIIEQGVSRFFPVKPHIMDDTKTASCTTRDVSVVDDFRQRLNYNYNNLIGSYGTGSMSQKISAREMIFCHMSAIPEEFEVPLEKTSIDFHETDTLDKKIHKLIYQHTHQNTCMITSSPLATAEGMAVLAEKFGKEVLFHKNTEIPYLPDDHPVIAPIDAEAIYLNPRLGLVDMYQLTSYTPDNPILNMLRWHKGCCVVSGYGVISTGTTTLEQAAHNAASAERIARFRLEVFINHKLINGPPVKYFEPG